MKNSTIKKLIIFLVFSFFLAIFVIIAGGNTYTYRPNINGKIEKLNQVDISIEQKKEIIKINRIRLKKQKLEIELKSLHEGKAAVNVSYKDKNRLEMFYVHPFGVITRNEFLGKSSNDIIIPILIILYSSILLWVLIKKYKESIKYSLYQYKNIVYLAIIIFIITFIINNIIGIFRNLSIIDYFHNIIVSFNFLAVIVFPIMFITSILVIISNIRLIIKEGFSKRNILGIILSIIIIISTIIPDIMNGLLQVSRIIDIHNEQSILLYIEEFIEAIIFSCLAYLECVLISTIIISRKASKHIPVFNKDYIIILGCRIRDDGTLPPLLKGRVDRAIEFSKMQKEKTGRDIIYIPSGGQGDDEIIPEGEAIKNYLISQGVSKNKIIVENKSTSTYENIKFSYNLIKNKKENNIAFSTTNYHVVRTGNIAFTQNINMEGIGSKTKAYFWINAFIREFIATLYNERKKHLIAISIILAFCLFIILIVFLANII